MVAFDDTDSPDGMCTTYLATLVLEELAEYDLIGPPRLVRLNPNIPWKTRGNAAVCLPLGWGRGECHPCGELKHGPVGFYGRGDAADSRDLFRRTARVLESVAEFECDKTNPGLVVSGTRPTASLYWRAVREVVPMRDVEAALRGAGAIWKRYKNGRGIIGASAAMSWRPRDRTWEVIAYRSPEMLRDRQGRGPAERHQDGQGHEAGLSTTTTTTTAMSRSPPALPARSCSGSGATPRKSS